jgi:Mrp family chromosome partitioning ATPase
VLERPEALAAAGTVGAVVLVVEAGRTRREALARIREAFDDEGVKLLGFVLTKQRHAIPGWLYRALFP